MRLDIRPVGAPALSGLKATPGIKSVLLEWNPALTPDYQSTQIWTDTDNNFTGATLLSTVTGNTYTHVSDDTNSRYYWIRATNIYGRSDGPLTGPISGTGKLITSTDIANGAVDLSKHVTGLLSTGNITGLGALAILDRLGVTKVDGLGALATQNTVNGSTQVTNLGALAYANTIAANNIGAGTLAAGVIYAGTISADKITSGTMSADRITGGTITGSSININGNFSVIISGGSVTTTIVGPHISRGNFTNSDAPGIPPITATVVTNSLAVGCPAIQASGGTYGNAINITGGANGIAQSAGGANWLFTINPNTDNTYALGSGSYRWNSVYVASGVISTSDPRTKIDVMDSDLGLSFINMLRPVKYRQKEAENIISHIVDDFGDQIERVTSREGVRQHYGLLTTQVRESLLEHGVNNTAMWGLSDKNDPDSMQWLRYEQFIAPLVKAVQELTARVVAQDQRIIMLEASK